MVNVGKISDAVLIVFSLLFSILNIIIILFSMGSGSIETILIMISFIAGFYWMFFLKQKISNKIHEKGYGPLLL